jgi:hypothetical protein
MGLPWRATTIITPTVKVNSHTTRLGPDKTVTQLTFLSSVHFPEPRSWHDLCDMEGDDDAVSS